MTELLTAAQMRATEQAAIASGEVTGLELMERAGRGVVEAILEWRPELATAPHRAVVLCGPGNNGGDGFVVARLLKGRGWEVEVYLYGDEAKLPPDAAENALRWREIGSIAGGLPNPYPEKAVLFIDALFGTGLKRAPVGEHKQILEILRDVMDDPSMHAGSEVVALDAPSGLCLDSGRLIGTAAGAHLTVSSHSMKVGHVIDTGPIGIDALKVCDIGLPVPGLHSVVRCTERIGLAHEKLGYFGTAGLLKVLRASSGRHKYAHGHALMLSGGSGKGGAIRLAARGALRIGAGLVTVGCPEDALVEHAARLDAVMLAPIKGVDGLQAELRDRRVKAACIGPGFGMGLRLRDFVEGVLEPHDTRDGGDLRVVLDADALTEYRDDPGTLFAMLHKDCVLTPHEGEFGRLFPDILAKLKEPAKTGPAYSKVDATREAAKRAGCVVLFKGADTVIAHPDGRCSINSAHYERSAPWLATAGSGDVLAGFITGLLARGLDPMSAAETAAWLHVECALNFGPGLIAEDIPEQLPAVFRGLCL